MITGRRVVALVPMRHRSERVPSKNFRLLGGLPLYRHVIQSLLACKYLDAIAIDTDSATISDDLASWARDERVIIIPRPPHLVSGDIPMTEILRHDVQVLDADFYLQTHSTNPFLSTETISSAIEAFLSSIPDFDSLFTVTPRHVRLWDSAGTPLNHDPDVLLRTQDLPPVFEENSNLYIFDRATLERDGRRIGLRPLVYPMNRQESWDIDDELDFVLAEFLFDRGYS